MRSTALLTVALSLSFFEAASALATGPALPHSAIVARDDASNSADLYPAPPTNGGKAWADALAKAKSAVAQMSLEEKATFITGQNGPCVGNTGAVPRLNIPSLCLEDGPAGVRPVHGTSQFPAGLTTAATWDRDLFYQRSLKMGQEYYDQGVHVALTPVTGGPLGRAVRNGRNWEGWAADPYATGEASYLSVKGLQDAGVAATSKHFIGYEQETFRNQFNSTEAYSVFGRSEQLPISSNIDNKATHELYMWSFAEAVRGGTGHVMCSYNEVNQTHACANAYTQNHLLKGELNFQGSIMSDWGGMWGNVNTANGGLDLAMPGWGFGGIFGQFWGSHLVDAVNNGSVPEDRVTDAATRVLIPYYALGQDEKPLPKVVFNAQVDYYDAPNRYRNVRKQDTADLIRKIGEDSATLLKNTNGALPLKAPGRIAVIGTDAGANELGQNACGSDLNQCPSWNNNGSLTVGGGSGTALAPYLVTPRDAIQQRAITLSSEVTWVLNDTAYDAVGTAAQDADVTIVFVNDYATEGRDRPDIKLDHDGDALVAAAAANSFNVVVVMHIPGAVDIEAWVDHENVTAIIAAFLPGQETGNAIASVLFGDVSPSGKLPFTWGKTLEDYQPGTIVTDPVHAPQSDFTESLYIDYRYFDAKNITPRYEFGFGLSYTTFEYSDISIDTTYKTDEAAIQDTAEPFEGFDGSNSLYDVLATVSAQVQNTGDVVGCEVAQLYVSIPEEGQPPRILRGFEKLKQLQPGRSATASFPLRRKDLSVWSVERQTWYIPEGTFTFHVGASSRNLPLSTKWSK